MVFGFGLLTVVCGLGPDGGDFEFVCSNLPQWLAEGKRYVLLLRGETSRHSDSCML